MPLDEKALDWITVAGEKKSLRKIPSLAGIYVFADASRVKGFPLAVEPLYVGQASNLRRRFLDHLDPRRSHNEQLFLAIWSGRLEFWFSKCSVSELEALERKMIKALSPSFNQIEYKGKNNG